MDKGDIRDMGIASRCATFFQILQELLMTRLTLTILTVLLLTPSLALADVIPPDVDACSDKQLGDACTAEKVTGTCQKGEHCSLKYGGCDSGGGPCGSTCAETLKCKAGSGTGTGGETDDSGGCSVSALEIPLESGAALLAGLLLVLGLRRRT